MAQQKLYTEKQVRKAIDIAEYRRYDEMEILDKLTPLKLPLEKYITLAFMAGFAVGIVLFLIFNK